MTDSAKTPDRRDGAWAEAVGLDGYETPTHFRRIEIGVFDGEGEFHVVGRLRDDRPWAVRPEDHEHLHDMVLRITVTVPAMIITAAHAEFLVYPHAECPNIESAFSGLVGLSVARGYTRAVQERFGQERGCNHLEVLARMIGPAVIQALSSWGQRHPEMTSERSRTRSDAPRQIAGSCHVWAEDGPALQKLALGWRPGDTPHPIPTVVELQRSMSRPATPTSTAPD